MPILLELAVVVDGVVEDLDRLALAAPDDLAPPDEQCLICHLALLGRGVTLT
jgi:hypothetical protein